MARKLVGPARKSSHNQSRTTPYQLPSQLPYRGPSVPFAEPQSGLRYRTHQVPQEVQRDFNQTLGPDPETSWSSSDGPATPDSPPVSPVVSPYVANASPELVNQYSASFDTDTPCSDELSGFVFVDQSLHSLEPFNYPSPQPLSPWPEQPQTFDILTPTESTSSTLTGIQSSPDTDRFVHHVEFPNGPTPTRLQPLPQSQTPWAHNSLRQYELMNIDSDSTPPSAAALSPASNTDRARRKGPLSVDGRRNANRVRDVGACLRCLLMKEKCDDNDVECSNCKKKAPRKWHLGCMRIKLYDLAHLLFPKPLEERYSMGPTNRYVEGSGFTYVHEQRHFTLRMGMGVGGPLIEMPVKEITPMDCHRIKHTFQVNTTTGNLEPRTTWDPPIVPYLVDKDAYVKGLFEQLGKSMKHVFERKDDHNAYYWPAECFDGLECKWVSEVVEQIHDFHQQAGDIQYFRPIRTAHTVLYFNYMLDHPLLVRGSELQRLFNNLSDPPEQSSVLKYIAPEAVIRFIKATIFPELKKRTTALLKTLHETLLAMATTKANTPAGASVAQRDLVFSLAFMLLVIIGQTQARLLLLHELSKDQAGINLSFPEAKEHIDEVEKTLAKYIISFHDFVNKKRHRARTPLTPISPAGLPTRDHETHSAQFKLMERVEGLYRKYRPIRPANFERGELDFKEFDKNNIHRLCWKFAETIFSIA